MSKPPPTASLQPCHLKHIEHLRIISANLDHALSSNVGITATRCRMPLMAALETAVVACQLTIAGRWQGLQLEEASAAPFVYGDPARLARLFTQLLSNASQYTPAHGHITISVQTRETVVQVRVRDNGDGIPYPFQPLIFQLFRQGPRPRHRKANGLGVGLSLAWAIAELHGGTLYAVSRGAGHGSEFCLTLPLHGSRSALAAETVS